MTDDHIISGLKHGFIDREISASEDIIPVLVTNDKSRKEKVITTMRHELETCDEFMFFVAFINSSGVSALAQTFKDLNKKGIKGKIVASQYQNFTEPKALKRLVDLDNLQVRMITEDVMKMHSKCYIFRHGSNYNIIIGSSNLTNSALCDNMEWNLKFSSKESGDVVFEILDRFNKAFDLACPVDGEWIDSYSEF